MKLPPLVRQIGKRIVKATPMLRRRFMYSSDYRLLTGPDDARAVAASSGGWFAKRTVERQERAYQGLIEAMKLFNEIKSDVAGTVSRILADNGALVKRQQPLYEVRLA